MDDKRINSVYIIMKVAARPLGVYHEARPFLAYLDKKVARTRLAELNRKATSNQYWLDAVPLKMKDQKKPL